MAFCSIFVPNFMLQAVVRSEPGLRERAVALIQGDPPSCRVVAAGNEAIRQGIRLGTLKQNGEQAAGVEFRSRSQLLEETAHAALLDIGWSVSPRIEDTAPDTIILDVSGLTYLFASEKAVAEYLVQRSVECGLMPQVAVAANADAAWIAARGFCGITVIESGKESEFLALLPVSVLSPSEEMAETWDRWGIYTCGHLSRLPILGLSERFGQEGVRLHTLARGAGSRSLLIAEPEYSFTETMELDDFVEELDPLSFLLGRLLDQLCARLASRSLGAAVLHVRFDLEPSFEKASDLRKESFRRKSAPIFHETDIEFPAPIRDSKMLLKLLRLHLQAKAPSAPIRKIALTAESARPRFLQRGLFLPSFPDPEKLELTIARIANLVGPHNVGSPSLPDTHRPYAFQIDRFDVPENVAESQTRCRDVSASKSWKPDVRACKNFRIFRPPIPLAVAMHAGRPISIILHGRRGEVRAASGPWRTSGDWWGKNPWDRDEWDVGIHFPSSSGNVNKLLAAYPRDGVYRLYRDSLRSRNGQDSLSRDNWLMQGIYD
jgi:protein ImuB